jgi:gliding motility-associated-like protein
MEFVIKARSFVKVLLLLIPLSSFAQWQQLGNQLTGTLSGIATQGKSVSISSDGKTVIMGGYIVATGQVTAWIFTFDGTNFIQFGTNLIASDNIGQTDWDNVSVSISDNGKTAAIGFAGDNSYIGATWIFTFNGTSFVQFGNKLVGTGNIGKPFQGSAVCLSGDGTTVIVGARGDNGSYGATWIFAYNGASYVQVGSKLVGPTVKGQGFTVSLSKDGKTAMVGGNGAWTYKYNGSSYAPTSYILPGSGTSPGEDGWFVNVSEDGQTAIAGGAGLDTLGTVYVVNYTYNGSQFDYASREPISKVNAYAFSDNGRIAILGSASTEFTDGKAYKYILKNNKFVQSGNPLQTSGSGMGCEGNSVDITPDGKRAIVGGSCAQYNRQGGSAWVYSLCDVPDPTLSAQCNDRSYILTVKEKILSPSTYQWYLDGVSITGENAFTINTHSQSVPLGYTCVVTNTCTSAETPKLTQDYSDSITVKTISGNHLVCSGDSLHLRIDNAMSAIWSNGTDSIINNIVPTHDQILTFAGLNPQGCDIKGSALIKTNPLPTVSLNLTQINHRCDTLNVVSITGGFPINGFYKYGGITVTSVNISNAGNYLIEYRINDKNLCFNSAFDTLNIIHCTFTGICERSNPPCDCPGRKCPQIFRIYNSFTPNGDGFNDTWVIDTLPVVNKFIIMDKWGTELFKAEPYNNDWDGKAGGKKLPSGIYYYILEIVRKEKETFIGTISIIY